jgi:hypothetical protein
MAGTAFNSTNWTGYDEQSWTNPSSALTDFTGIIDISNLSASFGSNVQSDGADIRVTKGDDTELAYDLIDWDYNSGSPTGVIRFLWSGTLSSSGTQNVRVWVGYTGGTATAYSANETYGSDNAYDSNWEGYWPLSSDFNDRTANGNDGVAASIGTGISLPTAGGVTGKLGRATDLDNSMDSEDQARYISLGDVLDFTAFPITLAGWARSDTANNGYAAIIARRMTDDYQFHFRTGVDNLSLLTNNGSSASGLEMSANTWSHAVVSVDSSGEATFFLDESSETVVDTRSISSLEVHANIGYALHGGTDVTFGTAWNGALQHISAHSTDRSADWRALEYDQTNDNATFWGTWTWNSAGGGGISIPVVMHHRRLIGAA